MYIVSFCAVYAFTFNQYDAVHLDSTDRFNWTNSLGGPIVASGDPMARLVPGVDPLNFGEDGERINATINM